MRRRRRRSLGSSGLHQIEQFLGSQMRHGLQRFLTQQFLQVSKRVKDIRLHGADRRPDDFRNLLVRHLVVHAKHEDRFLLPRQDRHRRAHANRALVSQKPFRSGFSSGVDMLPVLDRLGRTVS